MPPLASADVVAFGATADPAACRQFYEDVLGLRFVADEPHAIVFETPNAQLRIAKVPAVDPAEYTVIGWDVPDVEAAVTDLEDAGVAVERYDGLDQDDRGIATFPDGTRVAWFSDPDGNTLSVAEHGDVAA